MAIQEYKTTAGDIQLNPETRQQLAELERGEETYNDIVIRLIKIAKKHHYDDDSP